MHISALFCTFLHKKTCKKLASSQKLAKNSQKMVASPGIYHKKIIIMAKISLYLESRGKNP